MANKLDSLSGGYKNTGKIVLETYNNFCKEMISASQNIQVFAMSVAKNVKDYVMVEGKWYDDNAAAFARWWNDVKGSNDGIDRVHRICTEIEEIFEITCAKLCKKLTTEDTRTKESIEKRSDCEWIRNIATKGTYGYLRDLKKSDFPMVEQEETKAGTTTIANENELRALIKFVGENLDNIDKRIEDVRKYVMDNLLNNAVILPDFDQSVLNKKVNTVKNKLDEIQNVLYQELSKDQMYASRDSEFLKQTLGTEYKKVK